MVPIKPVSRPQIPNLEPTKMPIKRNLLTSSIALLRLLSNSRPQISRVSSPIPFRRTSSFFPNPRVSRSFPYSSESNGGGGSSTCWNCGLPAFLSCESCKSVQPVDRSVDYFKIFGLVQVYDIKADNLEGKYKNWQKKLHPDLVHTKSEKERNFAAEQSARVIDAYHTLSKPLSRALYLLQLEGIHVDEEKTISDPELLAEMMDVREAVEEASDSQALKQIESQIQMKLESWSNSFDDAFKKRNFDDAIGATQRMRYYERALEEIVKKS